MNVIARLLREPLLHFFAFGGLIFLLYAMVSGPDPEPAGIIIVGPERIERLVKGFQAVWKRSPTDDELRILIDDFVREEIYYREALALGMDRNDTIIRQRLQQKMEFLADTGADLIKPAAGDLEAHLAAHEQTFRQEPRLAFEQVFLGRNPAAVNIEASLRALRADPASDPSPWTVRTLLPAQLGLSPPNAIDGVFGNSFFDRLTEIPSGTWAGPVQSAYGVHLVRIVDRVPTRMPPLNEVREAVLRDWTAAKALELRQLHYAKLKERYTVEIHDAGSRPAESR